MRSNRLLFALAMLAFAGASAYLAFVLLNRGSQATALTWVQLANTTYPSDVTRSKQVTLHDGAYEEQIAPGSASKVQVRLAGIAGFGTLTGTNRPDAAVVLVSSGGGSGTFVHLVAVLNDRGSPHPVATVLLGDRIAVRGIEVKNRQVVVRMRVRGASDPLTSLTHEVTRTYSLQGAQLVLVNEVAADVPSTPPSQFNYTSETLSPRPGGDAVTRSAVIPAGQSANFVVHADAGQRLKVSVQSEFNNAVLSIQGLGDLAQLVSRSEFATAVDRPVPSSQDYSVRLISLAGTDLSFSVSMSLGAASTSTPAPKTTAVPTATVAPPTRSPGNSTQRNLPQPVLKGPFHPTQQPLAPLAPDAAQFAQGRSETWGAALAEPGQNVVYSLNGDAQLELASVVKVLIMAAVLAEADQEGRYVDNAELSLLWPMITESDNDAATALWNQIGGGQGLSSYLKSAGFAGIAPYDGEFWGTTTASANALAAVLSRMFFGDLLRDEHKRLALTLMESVTPQQRWGITAAGDDSAGDTVALKDGWYEAEGGWRVNSVGVILPGAPSLQPYVLAVLSNLQPTMAYGIATIEGIARRVGTVVHPAATGR